LAAIDPSAGARAMNPFRADGSSPPPPPPPLRPRDAFQTTRGAPVAVPAAAPKITPWAGGGRGESSVRRARRALSALSRTVVHIFLSSPVRRLPPSFRALSRRAELACTYFSKLTRDARAVSLALPSHASRSAYVQLPAHTRAPPFSPSSFRPRVLSPMKPCSGGFIPRVKNCWRNAAGSGT